MEKATLVCLQNGIDAQRIIYGKKHCFHFAHSTVYQLVRVADCFTTCLEWRHSTDALFIDVSRTFDKVWHASFVWKQKYLGIAEYLALLIQSYL